MKNKLLWLILTVAVTCALIGCAGNAAYKTLYSVGHTAEDIVDTYFNEVVAGRVKTNDVPKVSLAYERFQASYRLSLQLARGNSNAKPDTNIVAQLNNVIQVVDVAHRRATP